MSQSLFRPGHVLREAMRDSTYSSLAEQEVHRGRADGTSGAYSTWPSNTAAGEVHLTKRSEVRLWEVDPRQLLNGSVMYH